MPSKISSEARGSGITRHTRKTRTYDLTKPLNDEEHLSLRQSFEAIGHAVEPWKWLEQEIAVARRTLDAIETGAPGSDDPDIFTSHVGAGWYSNEILQLAKWIENSKQSGNCEQAAKFAYELGRLAVTIRMKNRWDVDVESAHRHNAGREAANDSNRLATDKERQAIVQEISAERGKGVRDACAVAAQRFPHLGKKSTFLASYYKKPSTAEG